VTEGRNSDFLSAFDQLANHSRAGVGLARARRPLNREHRLLHCARYAGRGHFRRFQRQRRHRLTRIESRRIPQHQIPRRPKFSARIYALVRHPFADPENGVRLLDLNNDHRFDFRSETFDVAKPFNVGGTTWQIADMTPAGTFKLVESKETVAEIAPPPDLSVGKIVPAFETKLMDGKTVHFPRDYKGKVVLLDFWATWCGPCMAEAPNVVSAYNELHNKGFEILGVSLDRENAADKVKKVTADKGMTWPQIYDGKMWEAEIVRKYGIESIPAPILVDGDTGKVLADQQDVRGEKLVPTLKRELEKKAAS